MSPTAEYPGGMTHIKEDVIVADIVTLGKTVHTVVQMSDIEALVELRKEFVEGDTLTLKPDEDGKVIRNYEEVSATQVSGTIAFVSINP